MLGGASITFLAEEVCWSSCPSGCNSPFHSWRIYSANTVSSQNNSAEVVGTFCQETSPWARGLTFLCSQTSSSVSEEGLYMSRRPLKGGGLISGLMNYWSMYVFVHVYVWVSMILCVCERKREKKEKEQKKNGERLAGDVLGISSTSKLSSLFLFF